MEPDRAQPPAPADVASAREALAEPAPLYLLPSQFFAGRDWRAAASGEIALRLAILEDAILCFERLLGGHDVRDRRAGRDAERWLFLDERAWAFSFRSVCDALDVDAESVRRWLLERRRLAAPRRRVRRHDVQRPRRVRRAAA